MNVEKIFGTRVFDDSAMKKRLPQKVYQSLLRTRRLGQPLDPQIADVVACAMKEWALEQGATHYSHWFQPLTGVTADQVELRFSEEIADLYLGYDRVMPQPKLDYIFTETADGALQYQLDTVYNYEFIITTETGTDDFLVICEQE